MREGRSTYRATAVLEWPVSSRWVMHATELGMQPAYMRGYLSHASKPLQRIRRRRGPSPPRALRTINYCRGRRLTFCCQIAGAKAKCRRWVERFAPDGLWEGTIGFRHRGQLLSSSARRPNVWGPSLIIGGKGVSKYRAGAGPDDMVVEFGAWLGLEPMEGVGWVA